MDPVEFIQGELQTLQCTLGVVLFIILGCLTTMAIWVYRKKK
jgi:hypothetical protein